MLQRSFVCLLLAAAAGFAAPPNFLLGINYSEWGPNYGVGSGLQIAADSTGALYVLSQCTATEAGNGPSCLTKYGADAKTVMWQKSLGVFASRIAVDASGEVYLSLAASVEKLGADGTTVLWNFPVTFLDAFTVDSSGRAFLLTQSSVTRLSATGTVDATLALPSIPGIPESVAVDPTGSYLLVAIRAYPSDTLALLGPGSSTWLTFAPPLGTLFPGIAVTPGGDSVVYGTDLSGNRSLQRFDKTGAVVFTKSIFSQTGTGATNTEAPGNLALDAAGNAYITSYTASYGTPTKNSLVPCGSAWLGVYAPDGSALQVTYLPGATSTEFSFGLVAVGGSSVYVLDAADATFTPSQSGPFSQYPFGIDNGASYSLFSLSQNANAQTMPLACVANAVTFVGNTAVAPGELVALYGNSLGPAQGVAPQATLQSPYPVQAGDTQVTFDGKPAPLLWAQDSQVNSAVPWSVAGPTTKICVTYNNAQTNCLTEPVTQFAPSVLTVDGVHAVVLNQDGTLNSASNPAPRDSIVAIWATGLGPITPAQPDGSVVGAPLPVNVNPVSLGTLLCIGTPCRVTLFSAIPTTYAGPAPDQIAGMTQINFNLGAAPPSFFVVSTASGVYSNRFEIYVAGQ